MSFVLFSRGFPGTVVEAPFGRSPIMWRGATDYLLKGRVIALCHHMLLFASSIVCLEHRGRFARPPRSGRDRASRARLKAVCCLGECFNTRGSALDVLVQARVFA